MGSTWVTRPLTWWRELSGPVKFRLYTRLSEEIGLVVAVVLLAVNAHGAAPAAGIVVTGAATVAAVEARPELAVWPGPGYRRRAPVLAAVVLSAVAVSFALVARLADADELVRDAEVLGSATVWFAVLGLVAFAPRRWWLLFGLSAVTGLVFGGSWLDSLRLSGISLGVGALMIGATRLTVWSLRVIDDLERARTVEARLQVAEERLRFSRDLHDVVGRAFSTIAVKSELATALAHAGEADRAAGEMTEVKTVAVDSMAEMRSLVRRYRDLDLHAEVAGARSLLAAAGCRLSVEGDPEAVPGPMHDLAAWVVREGTTNVVRHASARTATLAFGRHGMSMRNDGVTRTPGGWTGLRGLAERAAAVGGTIGTETSGDEFVLEIRWEAA